ncbi:hypothetical protein MRB53_041985 [Persea americana]|nr:hypothetical protein MRB53_041985 [Persea americana]
MATTSTRPSFPPGPSSPSPSSPADAPRFPAPLRPPPPYPPPPPPPSSLPAPASSRLYAGLTPSAPPPIPPASPPPSAQPRAHHPPLPRPAVAAPVAVQHHAPVAPRSISPAPPSRRSEERRRGSFSFRKRSNSHSAALERPPGTISAPIPLDVSATFYDPSRPPKQTHTGAHYYIAGPDAPPLPATRSPALAAPRRAPLPSPHPSSPPTMLRKASKVRAQQAEAERQARLAAQPREPPHLPSLSPLPGMSTFGGESSPTPASNTTRTTTDMSRSSASTPFTSSSPAAASSVAARADGDPATGTPATRAAMNGEYVADSSPSTAERVSSMAHRGRYSYSSSQVDAINSPRRVRRRKDPTPFNVLVIGAKSSGKTSFISFLRHSLTSAKQSADQSPEPRVGGSKKSFTSHYLESEFDGERVGVTLWDSTGLERNVVDLQMREITAFVEAKFEDTFMEEQKVVRSPGFRDTHIHCVFLVLDPVRIDASIAASEVFQKVGSLADSLDSELDLQVLRALWGKTTVIPVISKADTLTVSHLNFLKRAVWASLKVAKLDPLEALDLEDDLDEGDEDEDDDDDEPDDDVAHAGQPSSNTLLAPNTKAELKRESSLTINGLAATDETPYLPMSILSPDVYDLPPYVPSPDTTSTTSSSSSSKPAPTPGRRFAWGFADPYNPAHCDFPRLRETIFAEWRADLRDIARAKWYESWRTSRLNNLPNSGRRIRGGVTPVAAVPKQARGASVPAPASSDAVLRAAP